jgi:uncharacterized protein with GYD domain
VGPSATTSQVHLAQYMLMARCASDGAKGVTNTGGTARRTAVETMATRLGGRMEPVDLACIGEDVYTVIERADNKVAAAVTPAVDSAGPASARTVVLMTQKGSTTPPLGRCTTPRPATDTSRRSPPGRTSRKRCLLLPRVPTERATWPRPTESNTPASPVQREAEAVSYTCSAGSLNGSVVPLDQHLTALDSVADSHVDRLDLAILGRRHLGLHLHGLQYQQGVTGLHI